MPTKAQAKRDKNRKRMQDQRANNNQDSSAASQRSAHDSISEQFSDVDFRDPARNNQDMPGTSAAAENFQNPDVDSERTELNVRNYRRSRLNTTSTSTSTTVPPRKQMRTDGAAYPEINYCRFCKNAFRPNESIDRIFTHPVCGCRYHIREYSLWIEEMVDLRWGLCPIHDWSEVDFLDESIEDDDALFFEIDTSGESADDSSSSVSSTPSRNVGGRPKKRRGGKRTNAGRTKRIKLELESERSIAADADRDLQNEARNSEDEISVIDPIETDAVFSVPSLPTRASSRVSRPPSRLSESPDSQNWPPFRPVTHNCHLSHFGFGCAAKSAGHMPAYFNSIFKDGKNTTTKCPYPTCRAWLFDHEAQGDTASSKCCSKGRVDLSKQFAEAQDYPIALRGLIYEPIPDFARWKEMLLRHAIEINSLLSFGQIVIHREYGFNEAHRIVKCNNMIQYMLWDFNHPEGQDQPLLHGQLFTIPSEAAHARLGEIVAENDRIDVNLLQFLYDILRENHWMATLYRIAAHQYRELSDEDKLKFRMHIVDANRYGQDVIVNDPNAEEIDVQIHPDDQAAVRQIHRGRLAVENALGNKLVAQVYLDTGDGVPNIKYAIILKGRHGTGVKEMKWWNSNCDPALYVLPHPRGQHGFISGVPLRLQPNEALVSREIRNVETRAVIDQDVELGEGEQFLPAEEEQQFRRLDRVSRAQRFRYFAQIRGDNWKSFQWLWVWGPLAQHYTISSCQRMEAEKVQYMKKLQDKRRYVKVPSLLEYVEKLRDAQGKQGPIGAIYLTNEHFRGSSQYYQKEFANCMTISGEFGSVDLLITFTMDPICEELEYLLYEGQKWYDRPDIMSRLWIGKMKELIKDLTVRQIMGPVKAWFYCIEHQGRGLMHTHFCLILDWDLLRLCGITSKAHYMKEHISAEIPNLPRSGDRTPSAKSQRRHHEIIVSRNVHTCSRRHCLDDNNKCKKKFPMRYSQEDVAFDNAYPQYKRRPPPPDEQMRVANPSAFGNVFEYTTARGQKVRITNANVVPYNHFLSSKYAAHINVLLVCGDGCVKYICQYLTKGSTMAFVKMTNQNPGAQPQLRYDQYHQLRMGRYLTAMEAFLTYYGYPLVKRSHVVMELDIHTPEGRRVMVEEGTEEEVAERERQRLESGREQRSQLTAFFEFNQKRRDNGDPPLKLTYSRAHSKLRWHKGRKVWTVYVLLGSEDTVLSRIKTVSPGNRELMAIRLLLHVVEDPCCWNDLRTFNGILYATFMEAAAARGLLEDDDVWLRTVDQAFRTLANIPRRMRWLAMFFGSTNLTRPLEILNKILSMPDDWLVHTRVAGKSLDERRQYVLRAFEWYLRANGIRPDDTLRDDDTYESACEHIGLPRPENVLIGPHHIYEAELNRTVLLVNNLEDELLTPEQQQRRRTPTETFYLNLYRDGPSLNSEQSEVFREFMNAFENARYQLSDEEFDKDMPRLFFLTGEGGAGKTVVMNQLIAFLKANQFNILPMASTGIAAEALIEGSTVHKRLCFRRHVDASSASMIDPQSAYGQFLQQIHGIIIDEVSMQNRAVLEFVDRILRQLHHRSSPLLEFPFAGKAVIITGDWKQLPPVVAGGSALDQICASVKNSPLFRYFQTRRLTCNQRLLPGQEHFRLWLKRVGTGLLNGPDDCVVIPENMCFYNRCDLLDFVFPKDLLDDPLANWDALRGRAILCPTNDETFEFINLIMNRIPGADRIYDAISYALATSQQIEETGVAIAELDYENLIRKCPPGVPQHFLRVKRGAIMMLVTNISVENGLCNGTRVQILDCFDDLLRVRILSGKRVGEEELLTRIKFTYGADPEAPAEGPVRSVRIQFPLRPGNAMTINKSQSQTLERVGICLDRSQCFSHGQLYTAISRGRNEQMIRIVVRNTSRRVKNPVCEELIDKADKDEALLGPTIDQNNPFPQRPSSPVRLAINTDVDYTQPSQSTRPQPARYQVLLQFATLLPTVNRTHLNKIKIGLGNIVNNPAQIIVNAANNQLVRGSGVCGAIFLGCQPEMNLLEDRCKILFASNGGIFADGSVLETPSYGGLKSKNVQVILHAVGPKLSMGSVPTVNQRSALMLCYVRSLDILVDKKLRTITFPFISTGEFRYPRDDAAIAAFEAILNWLSIGTNANSVDDITIVGYQNHDFQLLKNTWNLAKREIATGRPHTLQPSAATQINNFVLPEPSSSAAIIASTPPPTPGTATANAFETMAIARLSLVNNGTDCFANSSVQLLRCVDEIQNNSQQLMQLNQVDVNSRILAELGNIIFANRENNGCQHLRLMDPFRRLNMQHGQQDAVEFLEPFLASECPVLNIRQLFQYSIATRTTCNNCGRISNAADVHETIYRVPVQSGRFALDALIIENQQDEDFAEDYRCEGCQERGALVTRTFDASNTEYLCMQFILFSADGQKRFPMITDFDLNRQRILGETWRPIASIIHSGQNINAGHYYAYCLENGRWLKYEDANAPTVVSGPFVSQESVRNQITTYVVLYKKINLAL